MDFEIIDIKGILNIEERGEMKMKH